MGGDLNLKKSWHPHLRKNQEKVWKEETAALEERKQIEKLRKEREEERDMENIRKLQEAAGGKVAQKRVDWMYSGPSGEGAGVTEEREGYLLGKRRIDHLLQNNEAKQSLSKGAAASIDTIGEGNAGNARDIQSKVSQDPLLAIQKQKMELQLKMMKDAQKRAKADEKRAKEKEREHKHRHRHSRRDRSRSRDSSDERERRHRHRHRSRSPHRRHRDDRDDYRRRERSVYRDSSDDRDRRRRHSRRSPSPRRNDRYGRDDGDKYVRRSRSPRDRDHRRDNYRRRSPSPYRRQDRQERSDYRPRPQRTFQEEPPAGAGESAADKLAKMQAEAEALEEQRKKRVRQREVEDAAEEEKHKQNLDGGHRFASGMRMKATENLDLGDVMARGRAGFRKEIDA